MVTGHHNLISILLTQGQFEPLESKCSSVSSLRAQCLAVILTHLSDKKSSFRSNYLERLPLLPKDLYKMLPTTFSARRIKRLLRSLPKELPILLKPYILEAYVSHTLCCYETLLAQSYTLKLPAEKEITITAPFMQAQSNQNSALAKQLHPDVFRLLYEDIIRQRFIKYFKQEEVCRDDQNSNNSAQKKSCEMQ